MPPSGVVERAPIAVRILVHVGALLSAVVVPAVLISLSGGVTKFAPFFFEPALLWAVVIGAPMYLALRWKRWVNIGTALLGGLLVVAMPLAYMTWPSGGAGSSASIDGVQTQVDGAFTPAGWAFFLRFMLEYATPGAIGGAVLWAVLKLAGELRMEHERTRARIVGASAVSVVALLAAAVILYLPIYTEDRTCHAEGMAAQGRGIALTVPESEWGALRDVLRRYADAHGLSHRDLSEERPDVVRILYVSSCDARVRFSINEQRWASNGYRGLRPDGALEIWVNHARDEETWRPLEVDLISDLRQRWPEDVRFFDVNGYVAIPSDLAPASPELNPLR